MAAFQGYAYKQNVHKENKLIIVMDTVLILGIEVPIIWVVPEIYIKENKEIKKIYIYNSSLIPINLVEASSNQPKSKD